VALATRPVSSVAARPSVLQLQQARQAQPLLTRLRQQTTRAYATNNNNVRSEGCSSRSHGGGDRAASSNLRAPGVWTLLLSASGVILGVVLLVDSTDPLACAAAAAPAAKPSSPKLATAPAPVPTGEPALPPKGGWPLFSADDIAAHNTPTNRIWVSFKDGVYDITDFVALHPGQTTAAKCVMTQQSLAMGNRRCRCSLVTDLPHCCSAPFFSVCRRC
jgi:hypothetical protein